MKCSEAKKLIDRRLDRAAEDAAFDWAPLEAHLAGCPKCAADWRELTQTNDRLRALREAGPSNEELDTMWQAIATTPIEGMTLLRPLRSGVVWRFIAASTTVAACLTVAFLLGQEKYGSIRLPIPSLSANRNAVAPKSVEAIDAAYGRFATGHSARGRMDVLASDAKTMPGFLSPSSGGSLESNAEFLAKFDKLGGVSYGYGVPYGPIGTTASPTDQSRDREGADIRFGAERTPDFCWSGETASERNTDDTSVGGGVIRRGAAVVQKKAEPENTSAGRDVSLGKKVTTPQPPSGTTGRDRWGVVQSEIADADGVDDEPARSDLFFGGAAIVQSNQARGFDSSEVGQMVEGVEAVTSAPLTAAAGNYFFAEGDVADAGVRKERYVAEQEPGPAPGEGRATTEEAAAPTRGEPATTPPPADAAAPALPSSLKIIKTGELMLEVEAYAEAAARVGQVVKDHGAFIADASTTEKTGGALWGALVIRVAPPQFDSLYAALKRIGRLESESAKAADVTAQYVDIEARLKSLTLAEERLQELIKTKSFIDRMSSLLEVERELTRVRSEIEQYEGQLRVLADRVSLSTITLHVHEPARIVPGATLAVEVPVLDDAVAGLNALLAELDGRLVSGKIEKTGSGALAGNYTLRVSLARFGAAIDGIAALGRVERRDVKDWQARDAAAAWASKANCDINLALHERDPQLPSGEIAVEVPDLAAATTQLDALRVETGAVLATSDLTRREDGSSSAKITLRVPAGRFADLVARLSAIGRTTQKQTSGAVGGVVGGAADVPCNLVLTLAEPVRQVPSGEMTIAVDRFAAARDALSKLVADHQLQVLSAASVQRTDGTWMGRFRLGIPAGQLDEVVSRLESLGRVASRQIAGAGLGNLAPTTPGAIGVIDLLLGEKEALSPAPDQTSGSLRQRIRDGLAGLYTSLGLIVYGLVVLAPWLVLALAAGWLFVRLWRRRQTKAK